MNMPRLHSHKSMSPIRSTLRQHMPAPEVILWSKLRKSQLNGFRFRRQHSIGRYIVDFYCPAKKLAIELDGDSHYTPDSIVYDKIRDEFIATCEIVTIRFTNEEIIKNLNGVLDVILDILKTLPPPPPALSAGAPPQTGGENAIVSATA
jgi:very-short-patch-repair endonuclease